MSFVRRWGGWLALAVVVAVALAIAARPSRGDSSAPARVARLTSEIRCPTCSGLSVAQSDAETAQAIRQEVTREVAAGRTDSQILASIESTYGSDILLRPPASGVEGLVWVLPVIAFVAAAGGLAFAFRRWRAAVAVTATPVDHARVAQALAEEDAPGSDT